MKRIGSILVLALSLMVMCTGVIGASNDLPASVTNGYFCDDYNDVNNFRQPTRLINVLDGHFYFIQNVILDKGYHTVYVKIYRKDTGELIDEVSPMQAKANENAIPWTFTSQFNWGFNKHSGKIAQFVIYDSYSPSSFTDKDAKVIDVFEAYIN